MSDAYEIARDACVGTTLSPAAMEGLMMAVGHVVMRRPELYKDITFERAKGIDF